MQDKNTRKETDKTHQSNSIWILSEQHLYTPQIYTPLSLSGCKNTDAQDQDIYSQIFLCNKCVFICIFHITMVMSSYREYSMYSK